MKVLVTGAAGFIGGWLMQRLQQKGIDAVGIDNFSDYYSVTYKRARLEALGVTPCHTLLIEDQPGLEALFAREHFTHVIHLAAQAGVRYSVEHPYVYGDANLSGFLNVLDTCRRHGIEHLIYASSSSVYGRSEASVFREDDRVDTPASLYAATKRANELMARSYADLHGMAATGLRFFTVYGPWGRPDMAPMLFARSLMNGRPIEVFNHGRMARDFTWIGDVVEGITRLIDCRPGPDSHGACHAIYNIGRGAPTELMRFIELLEQSLGHQSERHWRPMQPGDVERTWADTSRLEAVTGFSPQVSLSEGIAHFAAWCHAYPQWIGD
ncbi:NAD-dependent epimerase/dehydratase family protein [Kushneria phosphatilytica]|uniref:NAD-dependent epimerase/dehydratase family protein n=1 Tax=Kushneria phosphatilytica TaxID=657387 RepID=A0A1S1NRR5_9GAMM|nr:NAD-dependent epimerase/dehydratase family protein [Kushneria phosphatilytica]OHV07610.1 protein CapI [Kushneria phosphatilytica]QEL10098.1 NAD-dependent epimerase/dehydratase family protein [Kushneria phosphatilytica]